MTDYAVRKFRNFNGKLLFRDFADLFDVILFDNRGVNLATVEGPFHLLIGRKFHPQIKDSADRLAIDANT
jgi:hypothetical protein